MLQSYIGHFPWVLVFLGGFSYLLVIAADWHVFFRRNPRMPGFVLAPGVGGNIVIDGVINSLGGEAPLPLQKPPTGLKWRPSRDVLTSFGRRSLVFGGKTVVVMGAGLGVAGVISSHISYMDPNIVGNWYLKRVQGFGYDTKASHQRFNELVDVPGFDHKARMSCVNPDTGNICFKRMGS